MRWLALTFARRLLAAASAATTSSAPSSRRRWCARQIRCGEVGGSEATALCSVPAPLALTVRGEVDVPVAIAAHRMMLPPRQRRRVPAPPSSRRPCDATAGGRRTSTATATASSPATSPTAAPAGATTSAWAASASAPTAAAPARPTPRRAAPASPTGGTPDMTCDPSVHFCAADGTCHHKGQKGTPCAADDECLFDYVCVAGKCDDQPRTKRTAGRAARPAAVRRRALLRRHRRLRAARRRGRACAKPDACKPGLGCDGGVCAPWLDAGGMCNASPRRHRQRLPRDADVHQPAPACPSPAPRSARSAVLRQDFDCDDGLYCRIEAATATTSAASTPAAGETASAPPISSASTAPATRRGTSCARDNVAATSAKSSNGTNRRPALAAHARQHRAAHREYAIGPPDGAAIARPVADEHGRPPARARRVAHLALAHGAAPARQPRRAESRPRCAHR